ncbi:MAG TPA: phosphatidylserine/phosphatidylglycerophosphate/cardiolipin synthase family protein, partial [Luteimicrobium sp.]|nr:phosphatidylserine/phosphatidylglycerophosphate/cardiolipin synthase family protein [Luteimicrobium sp.]
SLTGNYEINLEVVHDGLAGQLEDAFRMDESNSRELTLDEWRRRHPLSKVAERLMSPLRPFL